MRIPPAFAWIVVTFAILTAGLLRRFHDRTPHSPYIPAAVGSLLFFFIVFLLLVTAREMRSGPVGGRGVRMGSITPILLMLLGEKWISISFYDPLFRWLSPRDAPEPLLDAQYRALAGVALLLICLLVARFSAPARRTTAERIRPGRWPVAAATTVGAVTLAYLALAALAWWRGDSIRLRWPEGDGLFVLTVAGQTVRAFAEEVYYRGLILAEVIRLAPRLGLKAAVPRRWAGLAAASVLFSLEHVSLEAPAGEIGRRAVFTLSLGLLFGILVLVTDNVHIAAGVHAWVNWLLLGAAPVFVDASGEAAIPSGAYVGAVLMATFVLAYAIGRRGRSAPQGAAGGAPPASADSASG